MGLTLVIDQGTHASRAMLVDDRGEITAHAEKNVALNTISHERIEQDAEEILQSIQDVLGQLPASELRHCHQAALTTQRSTLLAWHGKTGHAITPALSWQDRRSQDELASLQTHANDIKTITGLPLSPHYGAGKMRWLLHHDARVKHALQQNHLRMGPLAAYLLHNLLEGGNSLIDHSNAHRSQLFDLHSLNWSPWLLQLFDIPERILPRCRPMLHDYGRLTHYGIPLRCVCGDQNAAMHGMGPVASDAALINVGTGAFVLAPTDTIITDTPLLCGIASSQDHHCRYLLEGTVNGAGAALDWAQQHYPINGLFDQLPGWLAQDMAIPLFINTVGGLGSPWWRSGSPAHFMDDTLASTPARYVAIIESMVFLLQHNIETLQQKITLRHLYVSGGLSRLQGLCQRLADLSRLPVTRLKQTEATALGAAWLMSGRPEQGLQQLNDPVFSPQENPALRHRFQTFTRAVRSLQNPV